LIRALHAQDLGADVTLLLAGGPGPLAHLRRFPSVRLRSRLLPALMTAGQVEIHRQCRRLKLDVVHDPTGVTPFLFARRHARTVVTVHDVFARSIPGYSSRLDSLIYKYWLPHVLPSVNAVITVSQHSQGDILKFLAPASDRVHIIPYGVTSLFRPLSPQAVERVVMCHLGIDRPYVLFVGALTQRKNVSRIVRAFARIKEKHPHMLLVLAGPRSWKQTPLEPLLKELDLQEHVHLTGPLTDAELPALYNGAQLFAFPSLYEGFGLPLLEAMACGTPVVTANTSSLPEVAGDAALLVDPYDVEAIAGAMRRVLEDSELAEKLPERGLARAAQFSWKRTARATVKICEQVLGHDTA
jgi:glycosyltransferase involved in cell wall biosynthesis